MSEEDLPESSKATKIFIVIFLLGLAVVLVFLFGFKSTAPPVTIDYNYFTFEEIEGLWQTDIDLDGQPFIATFRYNPEQVEDVYVTGNFSGFVHKPIYITFDPEAEQEQFKFLTLAATEISLHLIRGLNFSVEAACTKNVTDACLNRSIVSCDDENKSIIFLNPNPPTQITLDSHCVTLSGQELDLLKSVDRLLFQWYKIIR